MTNTKLRSFMDRHDVRVATLVESSRLSSRYIIKLRAGQHSPTLSVARALAASLAELTGKRVRVSDIFDLSVANGARRAS